MQVEFHQVSVEFNRPILKHVSFALEAGSFHYLTGPSGAGKTTILNLIYGELSSYRGQIRVCGYDLRDIETEDLSYFRRQVGIVFQDFYLLNHLTVLDNIALALRITGASWGAAREKALELINWVDLEDFKDAFPETLSGGQKQRVAIARAVLRRPQILLADEPTGNVDPLTANTLLKLFEHLNSLGMTILMATHNQDVMQRFPHPVWHLHQGDLSYVPAAGEVKIA